MTASERLFDATHAFDHPVTLGAIAMILLGLIVASSLTRVLGRAQMIPRETYLELLARTRSWCVLAAGMIFPILMGAAWVCGFFLLLSLFCFREYARATGLAASRTATVSVTIAIVVTYFAVLDHWMGLFTASWTLGICWIAIVSLLPDDPKGYIRRVALAIVGFSLFGVSLGHLAFIANDVLFRPILIWILVVTELNDVFAYLAGKTIGKRKLLPNTSPNNTWGGAIGAVLFTSLMASLTGRFVFEGTSMGGFEHLVPLGLLMSILGQCGDLVVSSIKRDLGVKDMSTVIPGHGGLLDRFDSLLLVAPVAFHYIHYFKADGIGGDQAVRILTGG
ncbi:MAG: phosphatidate cytidylyltransferase [Planctomycetota bacterium]